MVDGVVEPCQQRKSSKVRQTVGLKNHTGPDSQQNDADVLNTVVREEAFQIMLHQRVHHAKQRRYGADHEDGESPPPRELASEKIPIDPYERIDGGLDHHA